MTRESQTQTGDRFPKTPWTVVGYAQSDNPAAMEEICRTYWLPLYGYARRIARRGEDPGDLTQGFFEMLLTRQSLKMASATRGKLRAFLLISLKNFATDQHRRDETLKRGGAQPVVEIDALSGDLPSPELWNDLTPEREFDRTWARELLRSVLAKLGDAYRQAGKGEVFVALQDHLTCGETGDYASASESLGLSPAAIRYAAFKLRERYRSMLREAILQTVSCEDEVAEEMAYLKGLFTD
jgi:RNA polymerase sigma-70 factor (ECF subfamily)